MKKVLFTATLVKGHIAKFHIPYLKWFKSRGYETWVIARNDCDNKECNIPYCDRYVDLPFTRNPLSISNIRSLFVLKKIIERENFDLIHTHTPVGSILTRLASIRARKKGTKLVYTAHGFHFFKGSSLLSWLVYYPLEKFFSRFTDALITINSEDYLLAKKKFYTKKIYLVKGVGVDFSQRNERESDLSFINEDDLVLTSVGELNKNKNHLLVLEALKNIDMTNIKYLIVGEGKLHKFYLDYIEANNLKNKVFLLGFKRDILNILSRSDIFIFPSKREGLAVSIMEAMYSGLPCIVSKIRGNIDLIDEKGGFLLENDSHQYISAIKTLSLNKDLRLQMGLYNKGKSKDYLISSLLDDYIKIYEDLL